MAGFTYNLSTAIGKVRLLIPDRVAADACFWDEEITAFLAQEAQVVKRAAALALETMASSDAYVQKKIRLLDLQTDGPAVSAALLARAAKLREQAAYDECAEDGGAFDFAEWAVTPFAERELILNEAIEAL